MSYLEELLPKFRKGLKLGKKIGMNMVCIGSIVNQSAEMK